MKYKGANTHYSVRVAPRWTEKGPLGLHSYQYTPTFGYMPLMIGASHIFSDEAPDKLLSSTPHPEN